MQGPQNGRGDIHQPAFQMAYSTRAAVVRVQQEFGPLSCYAKCMWPDVSGEFQGRMMADVDWETLIEETAIFAETTLL